MLCNQAVDYPKNGNAVDSNNLPRRLIPYKPDWKKGEDDNDRPSDFYRSERALGELYRYTENTAEAISRWGLGYIVLTSVDRDGTSMME